jgi:hypothetical protein
MRRGARARARYVTHRWRVGNAITRLMLPGEEGAVGEGTLDCRRTVEVDPPGEGSRLSRIRIPNKCMRCGRRGHAAALAVDDLVEYMLPL